MDFAEDLVKEVDQYNGFNLVLADICSKSMVYVTNRPEEGKSFVTEVSPGIHVLANARLDSPWPKVICFIQQPNCKFLHYCNLFSDHFSFTG